MKVRTKKSKLVTITLQNQSEVDIMQGIIDNASIKEIIVGNPKLNNTDVFMFLKHLDTKINS